MSKKSMKLQRWRLFSFRLLAWTSCCSDHVPVATPVKSRGASVEFATIWDDSNHYVRAESLYVMLINPP